MLKKIKIAAGLAAMGFVGLSMAQSFPDSGKVMTIVVPFAAGGPTDKVARDLAQAMQKHLKVSNIIIENVAGAGGTIGAGRVAKAKNDGYTLLLHHIGMATSPVFFPGLPYNTRTSFEYLGIVNDVPMTLVSKPGLAPKTAKDLKTYLVSNAGKVNYANAGRASASHLCGILIQQALNVKFKEISYRGTAPAMNDLIGGQVDVMCDQTTNTTAQIQGKRIQAYAVTTPKRLNTPALKNLPTMQEAGFPGFNVSIWHGLYAPAGTPAATTQAINRALKASLKDPAFVKSQQALGAVIANDRRNDPAGHKAFLESEVIRWTRAVKD